MCKTSSFSHLIPDICSKVMMKRRTNVKIWYTWFRIGGVEKTLFCRAVGNTSHYLLFFIFHKLLRLGHFGHKKSF